MKRRKYSVNSQKEAFISRNDRQEDQRVSPSAKEERSKVLVQEGAAHSDLVRLHAASAEGGEMHRKGSQSLRMAEGSARNVENTNVEKGGTDSSSRAPSRERWTEYRERRKKG